MSKRFEVTLVNDTDPSDIISKRIIGKYTADKAGTLIEGMVNLGSNDKYHVTSVKELQP